MFKGRSETGHRRWGLADAKASSHWSHVRTLGVISCGQKLEPARGRSLEDDRLLLTWKRS